MIRAYLIKLLFYLLDTSAVPINEEMERWLADSWGHPGFMAYVTQRDARVVKNLTGGDQLVAPESHKVWQMSGQRVEILLLANNAKKAFKKRGSKK